MTEAIKAMALNMENLILMIDVSIYKKNKIVLAKITT